MNDKLPSGVIPPRSKFKLVASDNSTSQWKNEIGRVFRIGYYSRQDGTDCIWLVNEKGEYEQTADRAFLLRYFEPVEISNEADIYGDLALPFEPLTS
jgi:hypothetical protein